MDKRTVTKIFRCTQQESDEIERRAKLEKKTQAAFLRDAALNRNLPRFDENVMGLLRELQDNELKIGVNINQVVRLCNSKKLVSRADYERLTDYLKLLMQQRTQLMDRLSEMESG